MTHGLSTRTRYARAMELSPSLLSRLEEASTSELSLRDEVALARTLLDEVVSKVAAAHGRTGTLSAEGLTLVMAQLGQINKLVDSAAAIEAKRGDQALSATHVLLLLTALRDALCKALVSAFGGAAQEIVEDVFRRQRWTGELSPEAVAQALSAPAAYEVKFRPLERADGDGPVRERHDSIPSDKLLDVLGGAPPLDQDSLRREIEDAGGVPPAAPSNGHNGNGHNGAGGNGHA